MQSFGEKDQILSNNIIHLVKTYARRLVRRAILRRMYDQESHFNAVKEILNVENNLIEMANSSLMEAVIALNLQERDIYLMVKVSMMKKLESYEGEIPDEMISSIREEIELIQMEDIIPSVH